MSPPRLRPFVPSDESPVERVLREDFLPLQVVSDRPRRRDLTCVNVEPGPKERFDRLQDVLSGRLGRRVSQWEAFEVVVALAEERFEEELRVLRGR